MRIQVHYPHDPQTGVPRGISSAVVRAVAAQVRAQLPINDGVLAVDVQLLAGAARWFDVNGRILEVTWHLADDLKDATGRSALGACQVEPDRPGTVCVLINRRASTDRPDLAVSTAAHELGHVIFDVPSMIQDPGRRYHNAVARAGMLDSATYEAEQRANDFMGALLVPPVRVHTRLLAHARSEGLRLTRAANCGRPGSPVLAANNAEESVAGVIAALANDFGVSDRFIAVRLARYGLIAGGQA